MTSNAASIARVKAVNGIADGVSIELLESIKQVADANLPHCQPVAIACNRMRSQIEQGVLPRALAKSIEGLEKAVQGTNPLPQLPDFKKVVIEVYGVQEVAYIRDIVEVASVLYGKPCCEVGVNFFETAPPCAAIFDVVLCHPSRTLFCTTPLTFWIASHAFTSSVPPCTSVPPCARRMLRHTWHPHSPDADWTSPAGAGIVDSHAAAQNFREAEGLVADQNPGCRLGSVILYSDETLLAKNRAKDLKCYPLEVTIGNSECTAVSRQAKSAS